MLLLLLLLLLLSSTSSLGWFFYFRFLSYPYSRLTFKNISANFTANEIILSKLTNQPNSEMIRSRLFSHYFRHHRHPRLDLLYHIIIPCILIKYLSVDTDGTIVLIFSILLSPDNNNHHHRLHRHHRRRHHRRYSHCECCHHRHRRLHRSERRERLFK